MFIFLQKSLSPSFYPYMPSKRDHSGRMICYHPCKEGVLPLPPLNINVFLPCVTIYGCTGVAIRGFSAALYTSVSSPVGICVMPVHFRPSSVHFHPDTSATLIPILLPLPSASTLRGSLSFFRYTCFCFIYLLRLAFVPIFFVIHSGTLS